jgi:CheY-specific phosphatase CheX
VTTFTNNIIATINYIECPTDISSTASKDFESKTSAWCDLPTKIHALDFRRAKKVSPSFYQQIWNFQKSLEKKGIRLVSINITSDLEVQLKKDGVLEQFGLIRDFKSINHFVQKNSNHDDVRQTLVKYLVESGRHAMETLFQVTVAADENYLENLREFKIENFHRASTIAVASPFIKAEFRLYFPKDTLIKLTQQMVGEIYTEEETLNSTVTELLNMIYGGAKSKLNDDKAYNLPAAIPTLVLKEGIAKLRRTQDLRQLVVIPYASPLGTYYLEVDFG